MIFTRKINEIFSKIKVKDAEGTEVWVVSWTSWSGSVNYPDHKTNFKAFLSIKDAELFAESLKDAHNLLQNSTLLGVEITKQD